MQASGHRPWSALPPYKSCFPHPRHLCACCFHKFIGQDTISHALLQGFLFASKRALWLPSSTLPPKGCLVTRLLPWEPAQIAFSCSPSNHSHTPRVVLPFKLLYVLRMLKLYQIIGYFIYVSFHSCLLKQGSPLICLSSSAARLQSLIHYNQSIFWVMQIFLKFSNYSIPINFIFHWN